MPCPSTEPPWEFLLSASRTSLQSYKLSRLAQAANLRKEIGALLDQWVDENACPMLARWLIERDERPPHAPEHTAGEGLFPANGHSALGSVPSSVSDNVFADRPEPLAEIRGPL